MGSVKVSVADVEDMLTPFSAIVHEVPASIPEEDLADCSVCRSMTPAKEKNCVYCGILREKNAKHYP